MEKKIILAAAGFAIIILLIISASISNMSNYYIKSTDGAVEIWQGRFAPMGKNLLITMPGVQPPELIKDVYSKKDVFPLAFNYCIDKSDSLLDVPGLPDFEEIMTYLNKALSFATTDTLRNTAYARLNKINMLVLFHKADIAASKGTISDLEAAKRYLEEAASLDLDALQLELVNNKIESIGLLKSELEAKQAEAAAEKAAAEKAAAEKAAAEKAAAEKAAPEKAAPEKVAPEKAAAEQPAPAE